MLASCKTISDFLDKGEVVARVGDDKLMVEELQKVIPNGISTADSITFARQYINSWALDQVFLDVAESQLSPLSNLSNICFFLALKSLSF